MLPCSNSNYKAASGNICLFFVVVLTDLQSGLHEENNAAKKTNLFTEVQK